GGGGAGGDVGASGDGDLDHGSGGDGSVAGALVVDGWLTGPRVGQPGRGCRGVARLVLEVAVDVDDDVGGVVDVDAHGAGVGEARDDGVGVWGGVEEVDVGGDRAWVGAWPDGGVAGSLGVGDG